MFADDRDARHICGSEERKRAQAVTGGLIDPTLDRLCGFKVSAAELEPGRVTYNFEKEFPIYSGRLVELQMYILSQNPNRIKLLWRDRRGLLRWDTFWAVVITGGIGLVLAAIQTGLNAIQIGIAFQTLEAGLNQA